MVIVSAIWRASACDARGYLAAKAIIQYMSKKANRISSSEAEYINEVSRVWSCDNDSEA